tara:strand:- start:23759 stop:24448 length:690 start_codon:yes stop_codon:yes gene_type:complete
MSCLELAKNIVVAGYPRSGTSWLTRLIADSLRCPINSYYNGNRLCYKNSDGFANDVNQLASCVRIDYALMKTHCHPQVVFTENSVFEASRELTVFIHRDPLDVLVSCMHYYNTSFEDMLHKMQHGYREVSGFDYIRYRKDWLSEKVIATTYEKLLQKTDWELLAIIHTLGFVETTLDDVQNAIEQQSFAFKKASGINANHYRKGQIGSYVDELSTEQINRARCFLGKYS